MARVEAASERIGVLMPTANKYPRMSAAEGDHQHEFQRLGVQFVDAGIFARLFQAALRHDGPAQVGNRAVGADHLGGFAVLDGGKSLHRFGGAQIFGQRRDLAHDVGTRAHVRAGHKLPHIRMSHHVAVVVHDEDGAAAHTAFFQPA